MKYGQKQKFFDVLSLSNQSQQTLTNIHNYSLNIIHDHSSTKSQTNLNTTSVSCLIETLDTEHPNVSPKRHESFIYFRSTTTNLTFHSRPWCFLEESEQ